MALRIYLTQNNNQYSPAFGKWYGRVDNDKPMSLRELAQHMSEHNCPYSVGTIYGVLTEMTSCIRELTLESKPVKLDGLGIFYASLESAGASRRHLYDLGKDVKKITLNYRGSDDFRPIYLTDDAQLDYTREEKVARDASRKAAEGAADGAADGEDDPDSHD